MEEKINDVNENKTAGEEIGAKDDYYVSETPAFSERKRWLFLGLPFTFTKYTLRDEILTTDKGFLKTIEDDCYMYKIVDVKLEISLAERLAGLGTVVCYTSDSTDKVLKLEHIKHALEVKNYILAKSEKMRMKRRTLNTMSLNADVDDPADVD